MAYSEVSLRLYTDQGWCLVQVVFLKDRVLRSRARALEKTGAGGVVTEYTENLIADIGKYFLSVTTVGEGLMIIVPEKNVSLGRIIIGLWRRQT